MEPRDRDIRIVPSMPAAADIEIAMEFVIICIQVAAIDRPLDQ